MEIRAVRICGLENPLGFALEPLLCSWKVEHSQGLGQVMACIQVSLSPELTPVLYEKRGAELRCTGERLEMSLLPFTRYYLRITVTDDAGETASSPVSWFETGRMDCPWSGYWIGVDESFPEHPELQKRFSLDRRPKSARLYLCGLGLMTIRLNGEVVGEEHLAPFLTDYKANVQACAYDVTELLAQENTLTVFLGNGWYKGRFGLLEHNNFSRRFALNAELRVTWEDGSVSIVATDTSWKYRGSVFSLTDIYDGETQDYLRWEGEENPWRTTVPVPAPAPLVDRYSLPVLPMEHLPVREVLHTPAGETVLDFGQNFSGFVACTQYVPRGTVVTMEFGELLQKGCFYHDNYRTAKSVFTYRSDGAHRTIRPWFTFFGFRYVKVSGLDSLDPACFTGVAVYSKMERTGYLTTGNPKINRLYENTLWSLRSNFLDIPTDCPQRDERLGWTGDIRAFCPTACYHMDVRAFMGKFLRDIRTVQQRQDGNVPVFFPPQEEFRYLSSAGWGDAATFLPMDLYRYYGSREQLEKDYPLMRDWVDRITAEDQKRGQCYLWNFGFQHGDWLALDGMTEQSTFGQTEPYYTSAMFYYASVSRVAEAAEILGLPEAEKYDELAKHIRQAVLDTYFTPTGRLAQDTQTGYLLALRFGLYRDKKVLMDGLRRRIEKDGRRIKCGFMGATILNTVLAENGMEDLAYDFLLYEGFPGWLYEIDLGATTIWERWNSILPDGTISGTEMNSLNHYAYGSVAEFLYRDSAGIRPLEPGFGTVRLAPLPDIRLGELSCVYDSASGRYVSNWKIEDDGAVRFHFEIPFGCRAELCLPEQEPRWVSAGVYDFRIRTKRDYRSRFTPETPVEQLLEDPRAVEIVDRCIPGLAKDIDHVLDGALKLGDIVQDPKRANRDVLTASLAQVLRSVPEHGLREEAYRRAICEVCSLHENRRCYNEPNADLRDDHSACSRNGTEESPAGATGDTQCTKSPKV